MRRFLRRAATGLLTLVLLAVAIAGLAVAVTGARIVLVSTDSMRPNIRTGDALVVPRSSDVEVGDVAVYRAGNGGWVVHRVVGTRTVEGRPHLVTKGDGNPGADPDLVPAGNVYGTAAWRVPWAGYAFKWLTGPTARLLIAGVIAAAVVRELIVMASIWLRLRARSRRPS